MSVRGFAVAVVTALSLAWVSIALALTPAQQLLLWQSPNAVHDGISLDFSKNIDGDGCCYVKAPGQPAQRAPFQSLFTFTRNSVGTFLGSNGLIQYANENTWLQSQTFDNASWTKTNVTVSPNTQIAPDGTLTADTIVEDGTAAAVHILQQNSSPTGLVGTVSSYIKAANRTWAAVQIGGNTSAFVNLSTCALGTVGAGFTAASQSVGNGWCLLQASGIYSNGNAFILVCEADNDCSFNGLSQDSIYVWGAQRQLGRNQSAPTYLPTTTTAKYDQPRIEYDASGNVLGLLVEGLRTNIVLQSEDFTTTWVNTNTTDAANSAVAPDGNTTADTVTASGANGTIAQNFASTSTNAVRTFSVYLKRLTGTGTVTTEVGRTSATCTVSLTLWTRCTVTDTALSGTYAVVTNVVTVTATAHGLITGDAARLDYTSGTAADFDCTTVTVLTADTFTCAQTTGNTTGNVTVYANLGRIKIATNTDAVYAWGGQGEADSQTGASSYVPTTTATVARATDSVVRTFGSEFSLAAGTAIMAFQVRPASNGSTRQPFCVTSGTAGLIRLANQYDGRIFDTTNTATTTNSFAANTAAKVASSYGAGGLVVVTNAGTPATASFDGSMGAGTTFEIGVCAGSGALYAPVKSVDYYPYQQPPAFLQQKTQPGPQSALKWPTFAANDNDVEKAS